jgi:hypothetical protein
MHVIPSATVRANPMQTQAFLLTDIRQSARHLVSLLAEFEPALTQRPAWVRLKALMDSSNTSNPPSQVAEIVAVLSELIEE